MSKTKPTEKRIDTIKRKCEEAGLNIYTVFREAGVPASTIYNWEQKEPAAFETFDKVIETITTISKEQKKQATA